MAIARAGELDRLLAGWGPESRLILFAGPDLAASHRLAARAIARFDCGEPPETIAAGRLAAEPGALADAAASMSLFGAARPVRVEGTAAELVLAIDLLLAAPAAANPVVAIAGELRKTDRLHKLVADSRAAHVIVSYPLEGKDLVRWIVDTGRDLGVRLEPAAARDLALRTGADQGVLAQELFKLALYADATPEHPRPVDSGQIAAIAAGGGEEEASRLVLALLAGQGAAFDRELRHAERGSAIPVIRMLSRRLFQMLDLARAVERGRSPEAAVASARPPVFWKEKDAIAAALPRWPARRVEAALDACLAAESAIKEAGSAGDILAWQALARLAAGGPFPARRALG
ncbi:MAG: DNA polymerase III subunit delta [Thermaurantiacus sp.]